MNGRVATLGDGADPHEDRITLDGRPVSSEPPAYWILNKPRRVLTTVRDPEGRATVMDLVPERKARIFPVGRLDRESEGLLLLTNDGELAQALLHPSRESPRVYRVTVKGRLSDASARRLEAGVRLEGGETTARARVGRRRHEAGRDRTTFTLTLIEGRKRQIRRSLLALGHRVVRLVRTRMGPLSLGRLPSGEARRLTPTEVAQLRRHARNSRARPAREADSERSGGSPPAPRPGRPVKARGRSRSGGRSSRGRDSGRDPSGRGW